MIEIAILKNYDGVTHKAGVQLIGSLTTYLDNIPVSVDISASAMVVGNRVILAMPGRNVKDAVVIATWPGGSGGGGMEVHGNEYHDPDFASVADLAAHAVLTSGVHGLKGQVGFSVYQTAGKSIPTGSYTLVRFDAAEWNVGGYFNLDTDLFTPLVAGKYHFEAAIRLNSVTDAVEVSLRLHKNGSLYKVLASDCHYSASNHTISGSIDVDLNGTTDYIGLYIWHNDTAARSTAGSQTSCWLQGVLIPQT